MISVMPTYNRLPVAFVRGEGAYLYDDQGKKYLDGLAGIAVCVLGHAHPKVAQAIANQAETLIHTSNLYEIPLQTKLAERLCNLSGMDNAFFGNSGAEANEAALKLARKYGHQKGIQIPEVVVMEGSFHGRTMATLSATGNRKVQAGFEPLLSGFVRAPYNDVAAIEAIAQNNNSVSAILVEPILGDGGVRIPDDDYLLNLRKICNDNDWLMMIDEVQTGNGRTGKMFAYQHTDILPDVVTVASGLGNGIPIGACLARDAAARTLTVGTHASTFGGNPLACAAAMATLNELENGVIEQAARTGRRIEAKLSDALLRLNHVLDVRNKGMMIAVELNKPCTDLTAKAMDRGLLLNVVADSIVRLLPPLNISDEEADAMTDIVIDLISNR